MVFSPNALLKQLSLSPTPSAGYVVAYSGGLDSHVLLHSLVELGVKPLRAIHINHQLHPQAAHWALHCQQVCKTLNVPLHCSTITVSPTKQSLEEAARIQRYTALLGALKPNERLLTAHHKNDQVETVLLHLLRGSGVRGLAGIKQTAMAQRPLLPFTRKELETYARAHKLIGVEDTSNASTHFNRNYLRHTVMPYLEARWPSLATTVARTAMLCADADALLAELAFIDLGQPTLPTPKLRQGGSLCQQLDITPVRMLSPRRQKNALRYWLIANQLPLPSEKKLQHILTDSLHAKPDAKPVVCWANADRFITMRRYRHSLYVYTSTPASPYTAKLNHLIDIRLAWDLITPLRLPEEAGGGWLVATPLQATAPQNTEQTQPAAYNVRFRQGGERCHLPGKAHSQSLKKLMQVWGIPPWERDKVPLLYCDDELIAVVGYAYCTAFNLPVVLSLTASAY